jgi:hypothetical protein
VTAAARLALFAVVLVVAGLLGAGLGAVVGPIDVGGGHEPAPASTPADPGSGHGGDHDPASTSAPADTATGPAGDHGDDGHDIEEPFEVPTIGSQEGGS